ncbi:MAG: CoA transferase [Betaproteobacteria bacterium]|nr:CoA transferase [Betaproteobacteria bacterium]
MICGEDMKQQEQKPAEAGGLMAGAPLSGVRVLDLSRVLTGPFCSMILGDLGAEVIKVEELKTGDQTRTLSPLVNKESHYFLAINRNKKSICVDLKKPEGRELVLKIAAGCDVVLENFRPGVLDRLNLGFDEFMRVNPRLIICSISGFGQTGPLREMPSFDLVTQAMSGVMSINGEPDGPPTKMGLPMGDIGGGLWAAIAILAGLQKRNATGKGSRIDISLLEGLMGLLGYLAELYFVTGESPGRVGSAHHSITPYGRFPVKDGDIVIALHVGAFWRKFCVAIKREDLVTNPKYRTTADRYRNKNELEALVVEILSHKTIAEWHEIFEREDIPHGSVSSVGEAIEQEVIKQRNLVRTVKHPAAGDVKVIGCPIKFDGFDDTKYAPSPMLGEHTRAVLLELGYSELSIGKLCETGVIAAR